MPKRTPSFHMPNDNTHNLFVVPNRDIQLPKAEFHEHRNALQKQFVRATLLIFGLANTAVLALVFLALFLDHSQSDRIISMIQSKDGDLSPIELAELFPRRITGVTVSTLIGATAVQVGAITYLIAQWLFKDFD